MEQEGRMSDIIRSKEVKVRKDTICFGCGRRFAAGTKMRLDVIADGGVWNCHLCETCVKISESMKYWEEFSFGQLRDEALEIEAQEANRRAET